MNELQLLASHFKSIKMASFSEAVQPILKFLQFCGIDFRRDEELGRRTRHFLRLYAALCLSLNIGWNGYGYVKRAPTLKLTTINDFVDYVNFFIGNVFSHAALYCMTFGGFAEIISAIQRLERLLEHDAHYYRKLRRSSSIAVTLIVLFVLSLFHEIKKNMYILFVRLIDVSGYGANRDDIDVPSKMELVTNFGFNFG